MATTQSSTVLDVKSTAFESDQLIPRKYTEDGQNISPPLRWSNVPAGVKEFAIIVDDPDAPRPVPWVHWVVYRIAGNTRSLPENVPPAERPAIPSGSRQGRNSWEKIGYGGPAPPRGHGVHHYHFKVYGLNEVLNLDPGRTKDEFLAAIRDHVVAQGELIATYERK